MSHPPDLIVVVVYNLAVALNELPHLLEVGPLDLLKVFGRQSHLPLEVVAHQAVLVNLSLVVLLKIEKQKHY